MSQRDLELLDQSIADLKRKRTQLRHEVFFQRFERRPDDLFIVTYPRSGTTWMQMLCHQLTSGGDLEFGHISEVSPYIDAINEDLDFLYLEALPSPRFLKTHCRLELLPGDAKRVYVARDAKDVMVSCYHYAKTFLRYRGPWGRFIDQFLDGKYGSHLWGSYVEHVRGAVERRADPRLLFFTYREMIADLESVARRLASFWGVTVAEDRWPTILRNCSLETMKTIERRFDPRFDPFNVGSEEGFIRSGGSRDAKRTIPPDRLERLERMIEDAGLSGVLG